MEWDLGFRGVGLLLAMSAGFGAIVGLVTWWIAPRWLGVLAMAAYFASGILVSEVWFGWATDEDLQPNIDGLSFDEVLLLASLMATLFLAAVWAIRRILAGPRAGQSDAQRPR